MWNLRVFPEMHDGDSAPSCCAFISRPCRKRRPTSRDDGGVSWFFSNCGASVGFPLPHSAQREDAQGDPRVQLARSCPLLPEAWKKELKDLASRVAIFTKESELKSKEVGAEQSSCPRRSCPTLCNPRDCSPPGSPIPGILKARTLKWVAISFSNA